MEPERGERSVELASGSPAETEAIARRLATRLRPGDLVALSGPLGAGKTCFVRGLAAALGADPYDVSSPTFVIWHEYANAAGETVLVHLDGYRLADPDELDEMGWEDLLAARRAIVAVEWPERFGDRLPADRVSVALEHAGGDARRVRVSAPVALGQRIEPAGAAPARPRRCFICGDPVAPTAPAWPFCSNRCRLVDLGRWFNEAYRA